MRAQVVRRSVAKNVAVQRASWPPWHDLWLSEISEFIYVRTGGVFGNVFVDFGPQHVLMDANGQASVPGGLRCNLGFA